MDAATVTLRAPAFTVAVRPRFGGQIVSLAFQGHELLAQGDRATSPGIATQDFSQAGLGGIDDCLPAIAQGVHPSGARMPDHGELWYRPAAITGRGSSHIVLSIRGEELPYVFVRRFAVSHGRLLVDYRLTNTSSGCVPIIWAAHPLFACTAGMQLRLPAHPWRAVSASEDASVFGGKVRIGHATFDLSDWNSVPHHAFVKLFAPWGGTPAVIHHPSLECRISIALTGGPPAHLGLWINRKGFPPEHPATHVAVEPTFGSSDDLASSRAAGTCLDLGPRASASWRVTYTVQETL